MKTERIEKIKNRLKLIKSLYDNNQGIHHNLGVCIVSDISDLLDAVEELKAVPITAPCKTEKKNETCMLAPEACKVHFERYNEMPCDFCTKTTPDDVTVPDILNENLNSTSSPA